MWLTRVSINQPVFATMVMVGLLVLGVVSYNRLAVEQMPEITPQMAMVTIAYPGASPEAVEQELVRPLENAVNSVNGISRLFATAREGGAALWVEFDFDIDANIATQQMRDRISEVANLLPEDAEAPRVTRAMGDENAEPIIDLSISSKVRTLREISDITEQIIVKRLKMVAGVGSVQVSGDVPRQIKVLLKPEKLRSYGVGVDEVVNAIRRANRDLPAGNLRRDDAEKMVRIEGRIKNPDDFGRIIVTTRGSAMYLQQGGLPVHLDQVADIVDGQAEVNSLSRLDGNPALDIEIIKVQGANVVATAEGVIEAIEELKRQLPEDLDIVVVQSNADTIRASLDGTRMTIIEGGMLTVLIVFLFLKSWRSTVITGLTLPISVIATFIVIYGLGFTLNMVTLMALSLCIGLLIDDAIVVRENIVRHLGMGKSHFQAAREGTDEIGLAVTATTLAIVAVFVPVAFMDGLVGKYFFEFGLTIAVAVMVSLFVSFTLDPMLSSIWHDPAESRFNRLPWLAALLNRFNALVDAFHGVYARVLAWALRRDRHRVWIPLFGLLQAVKNRDIRQLGTVSNRGIVLWSAAAVFIGSFGLLPFIGSEFMPEQDSGYISIGLEMPIGSSLDYTDAKTQQVERALRESPYIDMISAQIGTYEGRNNARLKIRLVDRATVDRPSQKQLEREFKQRINRVAGVESRIGWGGSMSITMLGPDQAQLVDLSHRVTAAIEQIPGVSSVSSTEKGTSPTIAVKLDRELANDLGLDVERVGRALRVLVAGDTITDWLGPDGQNYDVVVQLPPDQRSRSDDLGGLYLSTSRLDAEGLPVLVPLRQLATLEETTAPDSIRRMNMQRRVSMRVMTQGRASGDVGHDVNALIREFELPRGVRFDVSGQQQYLDDTLNSAAAAMLIAIIFIYLILASQFGSFIQPIAIMASLPLSFVGAFMALLITGSTLNMLSMIGMILLMGLVTKNAILLVDFTNQGLRTGVPLEQALKDAGQVRLRPILMTSMAMIFGMMPMALGLNPSGEFYAPMARAVIGGVMTSTLLTLVVVPVLCTFLYRSPRLTSGSAAHPAPPQADTGTPVHE